MNPQTALFWVVLSMALLSLATALAWSFSHDRERDWVENIFRSLYVAMQVTIWGNVVAFTVMETLFHISFGGSK